MRSALGVAWHKTRIFPDHKKTILRMFLRKLRVEKQRSCPSQEFSRTESQILGALSRLDDFYLNPLFQRHSARETTWKAHGANQRTNEDDSQSDPHPEASIFQSQTTRNSGTEDFHYSCPIQ